MCRLALLPGCLCTALSCRAHFGPPCKKNGAPPQAPPAVVPAGGQPAFVYAPTFAGLRPGYAFKSGPQGVGSASRAVTRTLTFTPTLSRSRSRSLTRYYLEGGAGAAAAEPAEVGYQQAGGAQMMAQPMAGAPQAGSGQPAVQNMSVQVPQGMQGGMPLQVQTPAGVVQVQIPPGLQPGMSFLIQAPEVAQPAVASGVRVN